MANGDILVDAPTDEHAELIVAVVRMDAAYIGALTMPADPAEARRAVHALHESWGAWVIKVHETVAEKFPNPRHSARRNQVLATAARQAGVLPDTFLASDI